MGETDKCVEHARARAGSVPAPPSTARPARQLAVVSCMDARLDIFAMFGLEVGDAHIIRNAGGLVTDDVVRSLVVSQRLLGTREIILVHHTGCGLLDVSDDEFAAALEADTGQRPPWAAGAFADLDEDVRRSIDRLRGDPFLEARQVRGFVYDVATGDLREVEASGAGAEAPRDVR